MKNNFFKKAKRYNIILSLLTVAILTMSSLVIATDSTEIPDAGDSGTLDRSILWSAQIDVSETNGETDYVIAQEATDSNGGPPNDPNDAPSPPLGPGQKLDAYFDDGLSAPYDKMLIDSRFGPDPDFFKVWNLTVQYAGTSSITLTWNPADFQASEYVYVNLTDASFNFLVDMKSTASYTAPINFVPLDFHIVCEKEKPSDVGVTSVNLPTGTIPIQEPADVQVTVKNFCLKSLTDVPVNVQIVGTTYDEDLLVDLDPTEELVVDFPDWTPTAIGTYTIDGETQLVGDGDPSNDASSGTVDVAAGDLAVTAINKPLALQYQGDPVPVELEVCNLGVVDQTNIPVHVTIDFSPGGGTPPTTFIDEDFNSGIPGTWSVVNNGGDCVWTDNGVTGRTNYAGGDGLCAIADADDCGSGTTMDTDLISPSFDLSTVTSAELTYIASYNWMSSSEWATCAISINGGSSWTELINWSSDHDAYGPGEEVNIDLTSYVGNSDVQIKWGYYAPGWYYYYEIDDVLVEGTSSAFRGTNVYDETVNVDVDAGECIIVDSFPSSWTPTEPGTFIVNATTEFPDDADPSNDKMSKTGEVPDATYDAVAESIDVPTGSIPPITTDVEGTVYNNGTGAADIEDMPVNCKIYRMEQQEYSFDFEADDGGWSSTGVGDWEWTNTYDVSNYVGTHTPPPSAFSGTGLWGTVLYDDYTNAGDFSYLSQTFDLSSFSGTTLEFESWMDVFGSFDYCTITVDGTEVYYQDTYNPTAWEHETVDLSAWDGQSSVEISFNLYTTTVVEYAGWYIDDVVIGGAVARGFDYIEVYSDTQIVDVDVGESVSVSFADWTPALPNYDYSINMTTMLDPSIDIDNANNVTSEIVSVIGGDVGVEKVISPFGSGSALRADTWYAYNAYDPSSVVPEGPISFPSDDPGTISSLAPTTSGDFLSAGCWAVDTFYASEYGTGNLYMIDTDTGAMTNIGSLGTTLNGMAYDDSSDTMYAVGNGNLYEVDPTIPSLTTIGAHNAGLTIISLACDGNGNLYGHSVSFTTTDNLYSFDPNTGQSSLIGSLGVSMLYAQDAAFDKDNGKLYLAGYTEYVDRGETGYDVAGLVPEEYAEGRGGGLYECDVNTGSLTLIGAFQGSMEVDAFAIPSSGGPGPGADVYCPGTYQVKALVQNYEPSSAAYDIDVFAEIPEIGYSEMENLATLAAGANTTVTFPSVDLDSGDYTVNMYTVMSGDTDPSNDDATTSGHVNFPPTADADGPYVANADNEWTVTFNAGGSNHPDGCNLTYEWDFDDGTVETTEEPIITHHFTPPEESEYTKTVTLTVIGACCGLTDTDTTEVLVEAYADPPVVQLIYPTGGESLTGTITVEWYATDNTEVAGIYLYYSAEGDDAWHQLNGVLENTGMFDWNTDQLSDGAYRLQVVAKDSKGAMSHDSSDVFNVGNGYAGVRVSSVNANEDFVKDGETITVTAGITGGQTLERGAITADLSGLGKGNLVAPDNYDGFTAEWTVSNIVCTPSDGEIEIEVSANEESRVGSVIADNTEPSVTVEKPESGLYLFNRRILPLANTFVIGGLTVEVDASDENGVAYAEFYLDDEYKDSGDSYYMNERMFGQHTLKVKVFDEAGNMNSVTQTLRMFNLFGE